MRRAGISIAALVLVVACVAYWGGAWGDDRSGRDRQGFVEPSGPPPPAFAASVEVADAAQHTGRIEWQVGPSVLPTPSTTIVGYEVEVVVAGQSLTASPVAVVEPRLEADLWSGFGRWDADVAFVLRVRAEFDDGTWSRPLSQRLVLPAVVPSATDWIVGAPETLVRDPGAQYGLPMWVDGSIGFASLPSGVRAFGANGPGTASWQVGADGFVSTVNRTDIVIGGQGDPYAAGGPVYVHEGDEQDPADDRLVIFYHGEDHRQVGADPFLFWSYLGMAVSDDDGESFTDAGVIVAPNIPVTQPLEWGIEVGGGAYAIVEDDGIDYFYVYFRDTLAAGANLKLAVARAPVDAVVDAAEACEPARPDTCVAPSFAKYDGSSWGADGVVEGGGSGGVPADLFASMPHAPAPMWFDVVELSSRGLYVLLFSWQVPSDVPAGPAIDGWSYAVSVSTDGLDWSPPARIVDTDPTQELIYLTLAAADLTDAKAAVSDDLVIYRTRTEHGEPGPPSRWAGDVFLDRIALTYRP